MNKHTLIALAGILSFLAPLSVSASDHVTKNFEDTVAGFETRLAIEDAERFNEEKVTFIVEPPTGRDIEQTVRVRNGTAEIEIAGRYLEQAGFYDVTVLGDRGESVADGSFEVFAGSPAEITVELDDGDVLYFDEESYMHIGIFDEFGNGLADRPMDVYSRDGEARKIEKETGSDGRMEITFTPDVPREANMTVIDELSDESVDFQFDVIGGSKKSGGNRFSASLLDEYDEDEEDDEDDRRDNYIDHFEVEIGDGESVLQVNVPYDLEVLARKRNGDIEKAFIGEATVSATDPLAQLPDRVRFYASNRGKSVSSLAVMFGMPGQHKIFVESRDDEVTGEVEVWVVGHGAAPQRGEILIDGGDKTISTTSFTVQGSAPAYANLEVFGNGNVLARGESDENGEYSISVILKQADSPYDIQVKQEGGAELESESITVAIDRSAPRLLNVTLLPSTVQSGQLFTVSVKAEAGEIVEAHVGKMASVILTAGSVDDQGNTIYQGALTAPDTPGTIMVGVEVTDQAGNKVKGTSALVVQGEGLLAVLSLTARAEKQDAILSWTPVAGATSYRVYFGVSQQNLETHIDTHSSATSARLTNLAAGQTYHFIVSALDASSAESPPSPMASATTQGSIFKVQLTPRVNGARMQWVPSGVAASSYVIRYGVQPNALTELRTVPGRQTTFDLIDLVNGATYYVSLSAVQQNGQTLVDTVKPTVVPGNNGLPGMFPVASSPFPASIGGPAVHSAAGGTPPPQNFARPPRTPSSGLPPIALAGILVVAAGGYGCFSMTRKRREERELIRAIVTRYTES
jgi:hypothetical protein